MIVAYWILAGLLALFSLYSGGSKVVQSKEKLTPMMPWAGTAIPMTGVRAIGIVEVLGAVGLIVPPLTHVAPELALVAAIGFAVLQVIATVFHAVRGETRSLGMNIGLVVVAAVTAWLATAVI